MCDGAGCLNANYQTIIQLLQSRSYTISFRNGIIEGFEPKFKSITKDCGRYFDALVDLSEKDIIKTNEVLELNATGSLWIYDQYIDNGLLDVVEADLKRGVTSRDFHGPLFENTQRILERLVELSENDRVVTIFRAAILHRLKALKAEAKIRDKSKKSDARKASAKWVEFYMPAIKTLIKDYSILLKQIDRSDSELLEFEKAVQTLDSS